MEETLKTKKGKLDECEEVNTKTNDIYPCDQWEFGATRQDALERHKESKHEEIRYPCDQCEYAATRQGHLKKHKESKHEWIRYPCDQCEYAATELGSLKRHKKINMEGSDIPVISVNMLPLGRVT